jgi:UDP-2,3-diacylglucosamine pyrophosphatase LpxH
MIIAVSDVHLGWEDNTETYPKQDEFLKFLDCCDTDKIDHFVLLGDIFDFWARSNVKIFTTKRDDKETRAVVNKNEDIFSKLCSLRAKKTYYIAGNHDYLIHELHKSSPENYPFPVSKTLRLSDGGKDFFFTHGYDLDVLATMELYKMSVDSYEKTCYALSFLTDTSGWAAVNTWGLGEKIAQYTNALEFMVRDPKERAKEFDAIEQLANSRALPLFLGTRPSDNLVYGHTHRAYYLETDNGRMIANTGCWRGRKEKETGPVNTYVKIDNGKMSLCEFRGGNSI